jgi:AraC family transcriptional regulator
LKTQLEFKYITNGQAANCAEHFDIELSSHDLNWSGILVEKGTATYFSPKNVYSPAFIFSMELSHDFDWSIETTDVRKSIRTTVGNIWVNSPYAPMNHTNDNPAEFLVLAIEPESLYHYYKGPLPKDKLEFLTDYNLEDPMLSHMLQMLLLEVINKGQGGPKLLENLLTLIVHYFVDNYSNIECLREGHQTNSSISAEDLRLVDQHIYDHMDSIISIDALASMLNMNKFHFLNEFKAKLGQTPYQYILSLRIEEAKNLLVNTGDALTDIALELGFNDGSHFSRTFKKFTGYTPLQYRKNTQ